MDILWQSDCSTLAEELLLQHYVVILTESIDNKGSIIVDDLMH